MDSNNPSTEIIINSRDVNIQHILDTPTQYLSSLSTFKHSNIDDNQRNIDDRLQGESRFNFTKQLSNTLQGRIYIATDLITNNKVIIKEAWRDLVHRGISRTGHKINENFLRERQLLSDISNKKNYPNSLINCIDLWNDKYCFYYAMPLCQCELFDYISAHFNNNSTIHLHTQTDNIPMRYPNQWIKNITYIFYQICTAIQWLHNNGFCHLDLSLENVMIYNLQNLSIKVIDFGLTKSFTNNCTFKGRIGKIQYMAPEVFNNKCYNGMKNDIYCLGVMLFMMIIGKAPYKIPDIKNDKPFKWFINGYTKVVLKQWRKLPLVTENVMDLMYGILQYEDKRMSLNDVINHAFFNAYNGVQTETETEKRYYA